jgi:RES domain-containing protein
MQVYRIARYKYARDLSGEGSKLKGGRWNHKRVPCVYTSASRALAVLEYTANVNFDDIPRALCMITLSIPDESILVVPVDKLPGDWDHSPTPTSGKDFGTKILRKNQYAAIQLPSAVIPAEFNYILNPNHALSGRFIIEDITDFVYDIRIKLI